MKARHVVLLIAGVALGIVTWRLSTPSPCDDPTVMFDRSVGFCEANMRAFGESLVR